MSGIKITEILKNNSSDIDIIVFYKLFKKERKKIILICSLFTICGLLLPFVFKPQYTSVSVFIPQGLEQNSSSMSLGGLASLAGVNLGGISESSEIPPSLYPKIASSISFKKQLIYASLEIQGIKEKISYKEYYESIYKPSLIENLNKIISSSISIFYPTAKNESMVDIKKLDDDIFIIEEKDLKHFERINSQLSVFSNSKEGVVTVSFVMPDPFLAAQMTKNAQEILREQIVEYKTQNLQVNLDYTLERFLEKKYEFENAQSELSSFRERNQNIISSFKLGELEKLEAKYNFAFNVYTEMAKQLEQAKMQLKKSTPLFTVIEPVTIPLNKSFPKRSIFLGAFFLIGIIASIGIIFWSYYFRS